jgi:hypothetical protein
MSLVHGPCQWCLFLDMSDSSGRFAIGLIRRGRTFKVERRQAEAKYSVPNR